MSLPLPLDKTNVHISHFIIFGPTKQVIEFRVIFISGIQFRCKKWFLHKNSKVKPISRRTVLGNIIGMGDHTKEILTKSCNMWT
jgi:hypothetical protein